MTGEAILLFYSTIYGKKDSGISGNIVSRNSPPSPVLLLFSCYNQQLWIPAYLEQIHSAISGIFHSCILGRDKVCMRRSEMTGEAILSLF